MALNQIPEDHLIGLQNKINLFMAIGIDKVNLTQGFANL